MLYGIFRYLYLVPPAPVGTHPAGPLHSPLMFRAPFASNVYHDMLWYPTVGRARIRAFRRTGWGELFRRY